MSDAWRAVLDAKHVQHVASETAVLTICGTAYVALDLHWAETTRIHCIACLSELDCPPMQEPPLCRCVSGHHTCGAPNDEASA